MGTWLALACLAVSAVSLLVPHPTANYLLAVGLVFALAACWTRGRGSIVLIALITVFTVFLVSSDGAGLFLKELYGINTRTFWRANSEPVAFIASLIIVSLYIWAARRAPEGWPRYVVTTTKDLDAVVVTIGRAASWLFIPLMLIIFYDISQRKIIGWDNDFVSSMFYFNSTKLQEMQWHLHATLFLLCLGFAYVKDAHVRIELVRDRMTDRSRVWMELLGVCCFLLTYSYLIVEFGYTFAERSWKIGEISAAQTGLTHRWIIKGMMPVGFALLFAAGMSAAFKCMVFLFGPADLRHEVDEYAMTHHADLGDLATKIAVPPASDGSAR